MSRGNRQHTLLNRAMKMVSTLLLLIVSISMTAMFWLPAIGHWLAYPAAAHPAEVIAVYGGAGDRTDHGINLYQHGLAPELWHTGYANRRTSVVAHLLKRHLPLDTVHFLPSHNTWEDGQAIATLAKQRHIQRILVVTSWYHSRRAMCAIKTQLAGSDVEVYYDVSPSHGSGPDNWWQSATSRRQVVNELAKLAYYGVRYGMVPWSC